MTSKALFVLRKWHLHMITHYVHDLDFKLKYTGTDYFPDDAAKGINIYNIKS